MVRVGAGVRVRVKKKRSIIGFQWVGIKVLVQDRVGIRIRAGLGLAVLG